MERATGRESNGRPYLSGQHDFVDVVGRLADYEDTGLSPMEIATIAKSYPKLFDVVDELERYRKAEQEGRLVVLPEAPKEGAT